VIFVPAFTGFGAPYWKPDARGAILGLTRGSSVAHIARAALESIAFQSAALLQAMSRDLGDGKGVTELRVDGGACVNNLLMQFQADLLGIPVVRPKVIETTALGAAYLAGLSCGVYGGLEEIAAHWQVERTFHPTLPRERAAELMQRWERRGASTDFSSALQSAPETRPASPSDGCLRALRSRRPEAQGQPSQQQAGDQPGQARKPDQQRADNRVLVQLQFSAK
jgi:glycerol kinase